MRLADDQREAHDGFLVLQRTDGNSITVSEKDVEKIEVDEEAAKRLNKITDVAASQQLIALPGTKQKNQNLILSRRKARILVGSKRPRRFPSPALHVTVQNKGTITQRKRTMTTK